MRVHKGMISFSPFTLATQDNFPSSDCVVKSKTEENIFYSPDWYECVIVNLKFPADAYRIDYCRPYVWAQAERSGFGWDKSELFGINGDFWPNITNPVRNEDMVVIAFKKVSYEEAAIAMEKKKKIAEYGLKCQLWDD